MALYLINGISTSEKSSLARELIARGYEAYDTERNGISAWFNIETGERVAEFGKVPERTEKWMNAHEFRMSLDWLNRTAQSAKKSDIFLCGGGANDKDVYAQCDKVFWLHTDEHAIRNRLSIPREHTYGTKPHELRQILIGNIQKESEYSRKGAVIVDATRPLDDVVNDVLAGSVA